MDYSINYNPKKSIVVKRGSCILNEQTIKKRFSDSGTLMGILIFTSAQQTQFCVH